MNPPSAPVRCATGPAGPLGSKREARGYPFRALAWALAWAQANAVSGRILEQARNPLRCNREPNRSYVETHSCTSFTPGNRKQKTCGGCCVFLVQVSRISLPGRGLRAPGASIPEVASGGSPVFSARCDLWHRGCSRDSRLFDTFAPRASQGGHSVRATPTLTGPRLRVARSPATLARASRRFFYNFCSRACGPREFSL